MKYRYLGDSGLAVSTVALGTFTFGEARWGSDVDESTTILNTFAELGGNFIDTADKYSNGLSEEIVGKWISGKEREDVVLATKCFFSTGKGINSRGLSRKHIISACDASLKRLNTDYIDLYQVHAPDLQTPIEETLHALDILLTQGKIRYTGCCNYASWMLMDAFHTAKNHSTPPFISGQYLYNLLKRDIENEVVEACERCGTGILCWSPLSGGMLTGKHTNPNRPLEDSRLALRNEFSETRYKHWYNQSISVVQELTKIAQRHQTTNALVALAWLLSRRQVSSVIFGARTKEHVELNSQASDWELPNESALALDRISKSPPPYPAKLIQEHNTKPH